MCDEPTGFPISGPEGNDNTVSFTSYGCPVFSSGEGGITEMLFVRAQKTVLDWIQEVALQADYKNPEIIVSFADKVDGFNWPEPPPEGVEIWEQAAERERKYAEK